MATVAGNDHGDAGTPLSCSSTSVVCGGSTCKPSLPSCTTPQFASGNGGDVVDESAMSGNWGDVVDVSAIPSSSSSAIAPVMQQTSGPCPTAVATESSSGWEATHATGWQQVPVPASSSSTSSWPSSSSWAVAEQETEAATSTLCPLTSASTTWDENISLAAQEAELFELQQGDLLAPIPEDLPLPFGTDAALRGSPALVATTPADYVDQNHLVEDGNEEKGEETVDWWHLLLDQRALRGRPRPPVTPRQPGRDPAALATPKCRAQEHSLPERTGASMRSSRDRTRVVDRWHNPDGTIRSRLQERLAAEAQGAVDPAVPCAAPVPDSVGSASSSSSAQVSFYTSSHKHSAEAENLSTSAGDA